MTEQYVAVKHKEDAFGEWSLSPKDHFIMYGHIPYARSELTIPNMEEVGYHTFKTLDGSDGIAHLKDANIEILENPNWNGSGSEE